jgi:hypothetical protein
MRFTIFAGLLTGVSLAVQVSLNAHIKPRVTPADSAIRLHVVAPWYIAGNDPRPSRDSLLPALPDTTRADTES